MGVADLGAMSVDEAVAFSGIPRTRIFGLIKEAKLVSTRIGKRRLVYRRSLVDFLESQVQGECGDYERKADQ